MPTYVPAKKNTEFIFYAAVVSQSDTKLMQSNPTIAAGDFRVSTDGGALGNLTTLPAVTPAGSAMIKFTLSATEMNGDNITVVGKDAAGSEWCDLVVNIQTAANQLDDVKSDTTAILADTADIQPNYATAAELAKVPKSDGTASWNATALAAINTEVDNSMVTYGLDHLVSAAVADTDVADNSIVAKFADSTAVTADYTNYDWTTDSLRAIRDHVGDGTNLTEAGGDGDHLTNINLPNQTMDITGNITGNLSGSVGSVTGAVGSVTGAVGSVTGSVGSVVGLTAANLDVAVSTLATAANLATVDTVVDAIKVVTDALGSSAAAQLALSAAGIIGGTAQTGTLSTTVMTSDLTGYLDDELIGRVVIWTGGTAAGQASDITDYAAASGTVTYTAIVTAPSNGDSFVIV